MLSTDKFWLPPGIVIPSHIDGALWKIQIRRDEVRADQDRYKTVTNSANCTLWRRQHSKRVSLVLVEGPFDAMVALARMAGSLVRGGSKRHKRRAAGAMARQAGAGWWC